MYSNRICILYIIYTYVHIYVCMYIRMYVVWVGSSLCIPPTRPHSFTLMYHNLRCICRGAQRNTVRQMCGLSFIFVRALVTYTITVHIYKISAKSWCQPTRICERIIFCKKISKIDGIHFSDWLRT